MAFLAEVCDACNVRRNADLRYVLRRASASLHFFTLRDSSSSVQLVSRDSADSDRLMDMPLESVVLIEGTVRVRRQKATKVGSVSFASWLPKPETHLGQHSQRMRSRSRFEG